MSVNNRLKEIRIQQNLSQQDLADAIGSCRHTISRIERGERNPSLEMALLMSQFLEVPVETLFTLVPY